MRDGTAALQDQILEEQVGLARFAQLAEHLLAIGIELQAAEKIDAYLHIGFCH